MADEDNKADENLESHEEVEELEENQPDPNDEELFDKDRAKAAMSKKNRENQNLRSRLTKAEDRLTKAEEKAALWDEYERTKLTAEQRFAADLQAERDRAAQLATELLHTKVRVERPDLTEAQIKRLVGDTVEDLVADAEELFGKPDTKQTKRSVTPKPEEVSGGNKPREEPEDLDPRAIVKNIRRR